MTVASFSWTHYQATNDIVSFRGHVTRFDFLDFVGLIFLPMYFIRSLATIPGVAARKLQDVVIIGGGPAGLSLLAALKASPVTRHLSCTLIEGSDLEKVREFGDNPPDNYTNRVVSLTPKSIEFMMDKIGSWNYINEDRIKYYNSVIAYDGQDANSRIQLDGNALPGGTLAAMAENLNIQSSLLRRIDDFTNVTVLDNTKVIGIRDQMSLEKVFHSHTHVDLNHVENHVTPDLEWPIVTLSTGQTIQARLLVGADGYNSPVRKYAQIESRGWQYDRFGVVATVKLQYEDYRSVGWQRFLTTGPLAILPLNEENATIVWSLTPELSEILLKTDPEIFPSLVTAAMVLDEVDLKYIYKLLKENPNDKTVLDEIDWRMSKFPVTYLEQNFPLPVVEVIENSRARFPLKLSHADTYIAPRVALIGDAAHTVHPLAGQGLNMGQSDVAALMEALETGVKRGMDIGSPLVLDEYVAKAWPANHVLMGVCDKLHKVFSTDFAPLVAARGIGMKALNMLDFVKDAMVGSVSGR